MRRENLFVESKSSVNQTPIPVVSYDKLDIADSGVEEAPLKSFRYFQKKVILFSLDHYYKNAANFNKKFLSKIQKRRFIFNYLISRRMR